MEDLAGIREGGETLGTKSAKKTEGAVSLDILSFNRGLFLFLLWFRFCGLHVSLVSASIVWSSK